jgi:O-antigen/teichoic acid export membrane protein
MVRVLCALVLLRSLSVFAFNGLLGLRSHGARLLAVGSAAAVAAVGTALLVPVWSWWGAAIATLVAELVFLGACWTALVRQQRRNDAALAVWGRRTDIRYVP